VDKEKEEDKKNEVDQKKISKKRTRKIKISWKSERLRKRTKKRRGQEGHRKKKMAMLRKKTRIRTRKRSKITEKTRER
jgi:hypothetical protein